MLTTETINTFKAYLESKVELSEEQMNTLVSGITEEDLFHHTYSPDVPLFRARHDNKAFDTSSPDQFGYIHDPASIRIYRYNLPNQAVLYTATQPSVAYKEIGGSHNVDVYLSVWRMTTSLKVALNINHQSKRGSRAGLLYEMVKARVGDKRALLLSELGSILEWPADKENQERVYALTSRIASKVLTMFDAIITTSAKSEGKELNITFNQAAADRLKLDSLYLMQSPEDPKKELLGVKKVGRLSDKGTILWYDYKVQIDSVKIERKESIAKDYPFAKSFGRIQLSDQKLRQLLKLKDQSLKYALVPNINTTVEHRNIGVVIDTVNAYKYTVTFKYRLV